MAEDVLFYCYQSNTMGVCLAALKLLFPKRAHYVNSTLLSSMCCFLSGLVAQERFTLPKHREADDPDNTYHDPNEVRKFTIQRSHLMIDEVELGSGNFGCVKKGVLQTEK